MSEVKYLHDWMNIAFGREDDKKRIPLDLRLHRRLGELYLNIKDYKKAIEQFEISRKLFPRDIFILRTLGRAYIGKKEWIAAKEIIERIEELDKDAFKNNVECAALKGRYYKDQNHFSDAYQVYHEAFQYNPTSYYIADLSGQMKLELGELKEAKQIYTRVLSIIKEVGEKNIWAHATAATAAIVLEDENIAIKSLKEIRESHPTPENIKTIEEGLKRVLSHLKLKKETHELYLQELHL